MSRAAALLFRRCAAALALAVGVGPALAVSPDELPELGMPAPAQAVAATEPVPLKLWLYVPQRPADTCVEGDLAEALASSRARSHRLFEVTEPWTVEWQAGIVESAGTQAFVRRPRLSVDGLCFVLEQGGTRGLRGRVISRHSERLIPIPRPVMVIQSRVGAPLILELHAGFPTAVGDPVTQDFLFLLPHTQRR